MSFSLRMRGRRDQAKTGWGLGVWKHPPGSQDDVCPEVSTERSLAVPTPRSWQDLGSGIICALVDTVP